MEEYKDAVAGFIMFSFIFTIGFFLFLGFILDSYKTTINRVINFFLDRYERREREYDSYILRLRKSEEEFNEKWNKLNKGK